MNRFAIVPVLLAACSREPAQSGAPQQPPVPVSVATAQVTDIPITLRAIGTVQAQASVTLRPQVTALVSAIIAKDGVDVRAGETILTFDDRPFRAALEQAQAEFAKDQAIAQEATHTAGRYTSAQGSGAVGENEAESIRARAAAAEAQVAADRAQIDVAQLNLAYCTITAPWDGRLGEFRVKPGAVLEANKTDLVDLTRLAPVDVAFSIPEQDLPRVQAAMAAGPVEVLVAPDTGNTPSPSSAGSTNAGVASVSNAGSASRGILTFIDNHVDTATGAVRLKATYDNADHALWPGRFVSTTLVLGQDRAVVIIPNAAIQPSQQGPSVFVVKADQTAEIRQVSVRRSEGGRSVVDKGVAGGEVVVTDGQLRLIPGAKVQIKGSRPAPATGLAAAASSTPQSEIRDPKSTATGGRE